MGQQQTTPAPAEVGDDDVAAFHENFDDLSKVKKNRLRRATSATAGQTTTNGHAAGQLPKTSSTKNLVGDKGKTEGDPSSSGRKYTKKKDRKKSEVKPVEEEENPKDKRPQTAPAGRPWWKRKSSKKVHPVWQPKDGGVVEPALGDLPPPQGRTLKKKAQTAIYKSCEVLTANEPPPKPPRVLNIKPAFSTPHLYEEEKHQAYVEEEDDEDCVVEVPSDSVGGSRSFAPSARRINVLTLETPRTARQPLEPLVHPPREGLPPGDQKLARNQQGARSAEPPPVGSAQNTVPAWTENEPLFTRRGSRKLTKLSRSSYSDSPRKWDSDINPYEDTDSRSTVTSLQKGSLSQAWDVGPAASDEPTKKKSSKSSKNKSTPVQQLFIGSNLRPDDSKVTESWASPVGKASKLKPFPQPKAFSPLPVTEVVNEDPQPRQRLHAKFLPPLEREATPALPTSPLSARGILRPATLSRTSQSVGSPLAVQSPLPVRPRTPTPGNSEDENSDSDEEQSDLPARVIRVSTAPAVGRNPETGSSTKRIYQPQSTPFQSQRHVLSVGLGVKAVSRQIARYHQIKSGAAASTTNNVRQIFARPQFEPSSSESEQSDDSSSSDERASRMASAAPGTSDDILQIPTRPWQPTQRSDADKDEEHISALELYNFMNDGQLNPYLFDPTYMLLIDTRTPEQYAMLHINTAVHILDLKHKNLEPFSQFTIIVIYDEDGLTHVLKDSLLSKTMDKMKNEDLEPCHLVGGFRTFHDEYPFLCTKMVVRTEKERQSLLVPYPSCIFSRKLYLGRGDQATNPQIIANLGITHIINVGREHKCPFVGKVRYLPLAVDDTTSADLYSRFNRSNQFIHGALTNRADVLLVHCNLGASRSATLIIAYLMITRHWTLRDAHAFVKEHRPIISPNRGFLKQLQKFEKALYGKCISDIDQIWL